MHHRRSYLVSLLGIFTCLHLASAADPVPADHAERMTKGLDLFHKEVAGLLKDNCVKCHGGEKIKGDFDLATREGMLKGGKEAALPTKHLKAEFVALLKLKQAMPRSPEAQSHALAAGAPFDWQVVGEILAAPPAALATRYNLLARAVKKCAKSAELDPKAWSPHKLRHAFATRMHGDGASMRVVQEALGHASIVTTQRYVNVDRADIEKFVRGPK
jgi:mono/diheme cytochrome c family protein